MYKKQSQVFVRPLITRIFFGLGFLSAICYASFAGDSYNWANSDSDQENVVDDNWGIDDLGTSDQNGNDYQGGINDNRGNLAPRTFGRSQEDYSSVQTMPTTQLISAQVSDYSLPKETAPLPPSRRGIGDSQDRTFQDAVIKGEDANVGAIVPAAAPTPVVAPPQLDGLEAIEFFEELKAKLVLGDIDKICGATEICHKHEGKGCSIAKSFLSICTVMCKYNPPFFSTQCLIKGAARYRMNKETVTYAAKPHKNRPAQTVVEHLVAQLQKGRNGLNVDKQNLFNAFCTDESIGMIQDANDKETLKQACLNYRYNGNPPPDVLAQPEPEPTPVPEPEPAPVSEPENPKITIKEDKESPAEDKTEASKEAKEPETKEATETKEAEEGEKAPEAAAEEKPVEEAAPPASEEEKAAPEAAAEEKSAEEAAPPASEEEKAAPEAKEGSEEDKTPAVAKEETGKEGEEPEAAPSTSATEEAGPEE